MTRSKGAADRASLVIEYHNQVAHAVWSVDRRRSPPGRQQNGRASKLWATLCTAFLPEEFPRSVAPEYLAFQTWDTIQALSSYIRGLLTSQAVLRGVGVGQQAATPLAAVFLFFIRDLAGMFGGILFAFWQGSSFDTCAKQWRLFADVANDLGMTVDLASPFFPHIFLPLACLGSIARAVTGVAGGATRAALTQHFALRGNAADVSAKESSQETATTLIGMILGMLFTRLTSDHAAAAWSLFIILTILHIWANIRALQCLVLTTINIPRLEVLLASFISDTTTPLPSPQHMSKCESLVPPPLRRFLHKINPVMWGRPATHPQISFGASLSHVVHVLDLQPTDVASKVYEAANLGQPYLLWAQGSHVHVVLHTDYTSGADLLQAYTHGLVLHTQLMSKQPDTHATTNTNNRHVHDAYASAADWMRQHYSSFLDACVAQGWEAHKVLLKPPTCLITYSIKMKGQ